MKQRPRYQRVAIAILRLALLVLPFAWLAEHVDLAGIGSGVRQVGWARLAVGLTMQILLSLLVSGRWRVLLASYGSRPPPKLTYLWRSNMIASYFSLLPVPAADEGVRVARTLHAFPAGAPSAWLVVALERICGLVGLLVLALGSSFAARAVLAPTVLRALAIGSAVAFTLAVPALLLPNVLSKRPALRTWVARVPLAGRTLAQLEPPARGIDLVFAVLLSVLGHFGSCAVIALLFAPLDQAATLGVCARMQPIVLLAMAFPVTPGGVGQRELVFAALYGLAGVSSTHAVTVALLSFALALALALVGGAVYAVEHALKRQGADVR